MLSYRVVSLDKYLCILKSIYNKMANSVVPLHPHPDHTWVELFRILYSTRHKLISLWEHVVVADYMFHVHELRFHILHLYKLRVYKLHLFKSLNCVSVSCMSLTAEVEWDIRRLILHYFILFVYSPSNPGFPRTASPSFILSLVIVGVIHITSNGGMILGKEGYSYRICNGKWLLQRDSYFPSKSFRSKKGSSWRNPWWGGYERRRSSSAWSARLSPEVLTSCWKCSWGAVCCKECDDETRFVFRVTVSHICISD